MGRPKAGHFQHSTVNDIVSIIRIMSSKPAYITIFYSVLEGGSEYDLFAKALLSYSNANGNTMEILHHIITAEFEANIGTPTSIMRGNTASSRILGLFCRLKGIEYLQKTVAPLIRTIVGNKSINFELDESKLSGSPEEIATSKKENMQQLTQFAENILNTITTPESILDMPRDIKGLAYHIHQLAQKYSEENTTLLVGGFIMLRFINPALLTPDFFGLLTSGTLSLKDRRNLTLLCKIIQNISNKTLFNEDWMLECNPFIEKNLHSLEEFYKLVIMDPNQESADQIAFEDLKSQVKQNFDAREIDIDAIQFFDELLSEKKADLLELFASQPHEIRVSETALELVELLSDYREKELAPYNLELYYSPLCPFSRAVWLFCLETNIPITTHKIDLLKEDQALDQAYKRFAQLSPSLQVPLLIDGDFVLEESSAICLYLCEKYFIGQHWIAPTNLEQSSKILQQLDWMVENIQIPILRLWEASKNPNSKNLNLKNYRDLISKFKMLNSFYESEHKRLHLPDSTTFLYGTQPTLVDLFTILNLSFVQLIQGFGVSRFPTLKKIYFNYINNAAPKFWKQINYEFEGFFKYVITAATNGNLSLINQSILLQESPHTIYEMLLDPENDIFVYLASKTISTKTNAKLKRGLKRMNVEGSDSNNPDEVESQDAPYLVNLEIGGEFNIRGREGTNLLLVPGKKIVQISRYADWQPPTHHATQIFHLEATKDAKTLLHFTEINCPTENFKQQEDNWNKFWKKINGVRVESLTQEVFFKARTPSQLYTLLTDWKLLSKTIKSKVKEEDGGVYLFNNKVYLRVTSTIVNQEVSIYWRCTDWVDDLFSTTSQKLISYEGGCKLIVQMSTIPYDKVKAVQKLWKSNMWKKLGGAVCGNVEQTYAFRVSPVEVCNTWLDGNTLTQKLKAKCSASKDIGSAVVTAHFKGTTVKYEPGKLIVQRLSHKDWPQHVSTVTLTFTEVETGTELHLYQENIPFNNLKQTADIWNTEIWEKLDGILITNVTTSTLLNDVPPDVLYNVLLHKDTLQELTGGECSIFPKVGSAVSMYDKFVKGTITQLEQNAAISMSIRDFNWPFAHNSILVYQLDEFNDGKGTILNVQQNQVPVNYVEEVTKRSEEFCKQLKRAKF